MSITTILFMMLTAMSGVSVVAGFRDPDNRQIVNLRAFFRFWLPLQIMAGLWLVAAYRLFFGP
jgi:hypothetical protein